MKRLIYIVAIGMEVKSHTLKAWEYYCSKHNLDFKVIDTLSNDDFLPHWERYTIVDRFPEYDEYIYVDADAIVKWDCPNLFNLLEQDKIFLVKDLGSLEWVHNGIKGYQDMFPNTKFNWWEYVTTGFIKFSKTHQNFLSGFIKMYEDNIKEFNNRSQVTLKKGFDQTPFNFYLREQKVDYKILPEVYSLGHLNKKDILYNGMFLNIPSYIWQFNGIPKDQLHNFMTQVWEHIKDQYK